MAAVEDRTPRVAYALEVLRQRQERASRARRAVLEVLDSTTDHLTAEEIVRRTADAAPGVHRATVYRTLSTLTELHLVTHTHIGGSAAIYHLAVGEQLPDADSPGYTSHAHLQCTTCLTVFDVPVDALELLADRLRDELEFVLDFRQNALLGTCSRCAARVG